MITQFDISNWQENLTDSSQQNLLDALEHGQVIFLPKLNFELAPNEQYLLSTKYSDPRAKNISYQRELQTLSGAKNLSELQKLQLKNLLHRYCTQAFNLIQSLYPSYAPQLMIGRTSYRPLEIAGRITSSRKDDKQLHVDAFPSSPNHGKRILRVFTNIHPGDTPRVWRLGESFETVAKKFIGNIPKPIPYYAAIINYLGITKSYRTAYDHYMLHIHDKMKADHEYQKTAEQQTVNFPPQSSWIVQTDQVSHAAMSGQYVLEQTFYLPVESMRNESLAPVRILERLLGRKLV